MRNFPYVHRHINPEREQDVVTPKAPAAKTKKRTLGDMLENDPHQPVGGEPTEETAQVDEIEAQAPRSTFSSQKKFDPSETMTPRLAIAQGLSPEVREQKARVGDFLLLGHDPEPEVTLVIAGHAKQRRFVEDGQQRARCWSPDGVQGYGNPGILCVDCEFSHWTNSGKKDLNTDKIINLRPACDEVDAFAAFSITHGMPVIWPLKGTGAKASRFIKTLANGLGMGNFAVKVGSVSKSNGSRAWHEPVITIDNDVTAEQARIYANIALGAVPVEALPASVGPDEPSDIPF